jgi:hypothetical protein
MDMKTINDVLDSVKEDIFEVYELDSAYLEGAMTALHKIKYAILRENSHIEA